MKEFSVVVKAKSGLHARPAGIFAKAASKVKSNIKLYKNGDTTRVCNPKSIISILGMGALNGDTLTLVIEGEDEELAAAELQNVLENDLES